MSSFFSKEVDYALQLVSALRNASKEHPVSLKEFSKHSGISFFFLQRIAKKLKTAGVVDSQKGPNGGYRLKKDFEVLRVEDILSAVQGETSIVPCVHGDHLCLFAKECGEKKSFHKLDAELAQFFSEKRVAEYF